jgi:hypothetical protein
VFCALGPSTARRPSPSSNREFRRCLERPDPRRNSVCQSNANLPRGRCRSTFEGKPHIHRETFLIWRQLSHPNLLPFFGLYHLEDTKSRLCLISPWMENGDITRYLKRNSVGVNRLTLVSNKDASTSTSCDKFEDLFHRFLTLD